MHRCLCVRAAQDGDVRLVAGAITRRLAQQEQATSTAAAGNGAVGLRAASLTGGEAETPADANAARGVAAPGEAEPGARAKRVFGGGASGRARKAGTAPAAEGSAVGGERLAAAAADPAEISLLDDE